MNFKEIFDKILEEDMSAASAGLGSTNPMPGFSNDFYAPGDARIPKGSSPLIKRNMSKRMRRKGPFGAKKKSKKKIKRIIAHKG